jgi:hypothetical protein
VDFGWDDSSQIKMLFTDVGLMRARLLVWNGLMSKDIRLFDEGMAYMFNEASLAQILIRKLEGGIE